MPPQESRNLDRPAACPGGAVPGELRQFLARQGAAEVPALHQQLALEAQGLQLRLGLHALGHHVQLQRLAKAQQAVQHQLALGMAAGHDEAAVDLDGIHVVASRSEEHTSELQSQSNLVCRLLLEKKKKRKKLRK